MLSVVAAVVLTNVSLSNFGLAYCVVSSVTFEIIVTGEVELDEVGVAVTSFIGKLEVVGGVLFPLFVCASLKERTRRQQARAVKLPVRAIKSGTGK